MYVKVGFNAIARAAKTIVNDSFLVFVMYPSLVCFNHCYLFKSSYSKKSSENEAKIDKQASQISYSEPVDGNNLTVRLL